MGQNSTRTVEHGFDYAWSFYNESNAPFLVNSYRNWSQTKPFQGLKVLHNIPLSIDTVCKVNALIAGGADVTVTCTKMLRTHTQDIAEQILEYEGVKFIKDHHNIPDDFDIILDCCAEFSDLLTPRVGSVELTQTGTNIYRTLNPQNYKVISVDDSRLKGLETFYGTGQGYINAFQELTSHSVKDKTFMVFGYGKVGQGVSQLLKEAGATVTIVDKDAKKLELAKQRSLSAISSDTNSDILEALKSTYAVVTATAIPNFISNHFETDAFDNVQYLTNIGAEDEWGHKFEDSRVLCNKMPINFTNSQPTPIKFLDAIFYAHSAAIELLLNPSLGNGYHATPQDWDDMIVEKWCKHHNFNPEKLMI